MGGSISAITVVKGTDDPQVAKNMAMQVASMNPLYVSEEDIPEDVKKAKIKELEENFKGPENMKEKIRDIWYNKITKYTMGRVLYERKRIVRNF